MKKFLNVIVAILLLTSLSLLGACGDSANATGSSQIKISKEYSKQLEVFENENKKQAKKMTELFNALAEKPDLIEDEQFKNEYRNELEKHGKFLHELELLPRSEIDKTLDELVQEVLSAQLRTNGATLYFFKEKTDESLDFLMEKSEVLKEKNEKLINFKEKVGI
jgi:uncharacterized protein YxeA